jgi:hypothetical protein
MDRAELVRLARVGAEARLEALQGEISAIYATFPDLRRGRSKPTPLTRGSKPTVQGAVTRSRRRKMSREARKRIAEAQRKRWAEWKAKRSKTAAAAEKKTAMPNRQRRSGAQKKK